MRVHFEDPSYSVIDVKKYSVFNPTGSPRFPDRGSVKATFCPMDATGVIQDEIFRHQEPVSR